MSKSVCKFLFESYTIKTNGTREQISKDIQKHIDVSQRISDEQATFIIRQMAHGVREARATEETDGEAINNE